MYYVIGLFNFMWYPAYCSIGRWNQILEAPCPVALLILKTLCGEWRSSTMRLVLSPERNDNNSFPQVGLKHPTVALTIKRCNTSSRWLLLLTIFRVPFIDKRNHYKITLLCVCLYVCQEPLSQVRLEISR